MKVGIIVQARMNSKRVPNKVALEFGGKSLLWHIVARLKKSKKSDELIIATGPAERNKWIVEFAKKNRIECFMHDDEKDALQQKNIILIRLSASVQIISLSARRKLTI